MLIAPASPPLIQIANFWRALQVEPLRAEDLTALADGLRGLKIDSGNEGYAVLDFVYSPVQATITRYRAMAFGYPQTTFILVARLPEKGEPQGNCV
jgi:hypothetical protein